MADYLFPVGWVNVILILILCLPVIMLFFNYMANREGIGNSVSDMQNDHKV